MITKKDINNFKNILEIFFWKISFFLIGFIISKTEILPDIYPLGLSYVASFSDFNIFYATLGSLLSYFTIRNMATSIKYVSSLIFFIILNFFLIRNKKYKFNIPLLLSVFLINFISGFSIIFSKTIDIELIVFYLIESFICVFLTYIFSNAYDTIKKNGIYNNKFNKITVTYLTIIAIVLIVPTLEFKIKFINLTKIFLNLMCLSFLFNCGIVGATFSGSIIGIIYYISNQDDIMIFFILNFSALITSIFYKYNKFTLCLIYFISNLFLYIWINKKFIIDNNIIFFITELLVSIFLFLIIPRKIFVRIKEILPESKDIKNNSINNYTLQKLNLFSETFKKINKIIENFSKKICLKGYKTNTDEKTLFNNNIKNISRIYDDLYSKIKDFSLFDEEICAKLKFKMKTVFNCNNDVSCRYNSINKTLIQITIDKKRTDILKRISEISYEISLVCGKVLSPPEFLNCGDKIILRFYEKPIYNVSVKVSQKSSLNSNFCGDNCIYFLDGIGNFFALLNDGEGTGELASLDGGFVGQIIKKLLRSGIDFETAIQIANSALISESERETSSTVDLFSFNMFTGKAKFLKAGATSTFIYKNGVIRNINEKTLPIGILSNVEFKENKIKLEDGDAILMVSDGVTNLDYDWVEPLFKKLHNDAYSLVNQVVDTASKKYLSEFSVSDDITALCINIFKSKKL